MEQQHNLPSVKSIAIGQTQLLLYEDPYNRRIRIDALTGDSNPDLKELLQAAPVWAEKFILKARTAQVPFYTARGWNLEGNIPGYFKGDDMNFLTFYPNPARQISECASLGYEVLQQVQHRPRELSEEVSPPICLSGPQDAERLAKLYATVFPVYPTPMADPNYVLKTMGEGTLYAHIEQEGQLVSAASAEINLEFANAELTDCATLPFAQGKGHMFALLRKLETELAHRKIHCLYTLCRAQSLGMNRVFFKLGYQYGGCLLNNCMIYSGMEDMNVWHKTSKE